jgi:RNA polymerase sigma factor (sigma-70 family)
MPGGKFGTVLKHLHSLKDEHDASGRTDGELLASFALGRAQPAFESLVHRHGAMVLGVCRRVLGNEHDAEDAFQASFLVLASKARSIRRRRCLASWLYRVAYRLSLQVRAAASRRRAHERQVPVVLQEDVAHEIIWRELRPALDQELDRLPDKYRQPVLLCYLEGKTHEEAARQLGWPKGTVAGRLARARELLRHRLARRGLGLSAAMFTAVLSESAAAATVPTGLVGATVKAAGLVIAGESAAVAAVSAKAAALAEGMVKTMLLKKLITLAATLVAMGGLFSAVTMFGYPPISTAGQAPSKKSQSTTEQPVPGRADSETKGIRGTWQGVTFRYVRPPDSRLSPPGFAPEHLEAVKSARWVIDANKIVINFKRPVLVPKVGNDLQQDFVVKKEDVTREMTYRLGADKNAAAIDLTPCGFPFDQVLPGTCAGIFELQKDTLILCYGTPEMNRPKGLRAEGDNIYFLFVLKKVDKGEHNKRPAARDPGQQDQPRTDSYGDPLPFGALARLGTLRLRRDGHAPDSLAFSPDGKVLISARTDRVIQFWETATGKPLRAFRQEDPFEFFVLSANGKLLATGGTRGITVWDVVSAKSSRSIRSHDVKALALAPDKGLLAAANEERNIDLWDTGTGRKIGVLTGHTQEIRTLVFTPDAKTLISFASGESIRVWDVTGRRELGKIPVKLFRGRMAVSADGAVLGFGGMEYVNNEARTKLMLWDLARGRELRQLQGHGQWFRSLALSPNNRILASTAHDELYLWDIATGKKLRTIPGQVSDSLAFSPDSKTLAATSQGNLSAVRLWDVATGRLLLPEGNEGLGVRVAFSPDGSTVATAPWGDKIRFWDASTGRLLGVCEGGTAVVTKAMFMPDGKQLVSAEMKGLRLWDVQTGKELCKYQTGHPVYGVALSQDGKRLTSAGDVFGPNTEDRKQAFVVWDLKTGQRLLQREVQGFVGNLVAFSRHANEVALRRRTELGLWNIAAGRQVFSLQASHAPKEELLEPVAFAPDGKTAAAATYQGASPGQPPEYAIYLWELATGQVTMRIVGIKTRLEALVFAADGRTLASGGDDRIQLWNVATGQELLSRCVPDARVRLGGLAFSPDSSRLAVGYGDATALIWDMRPATGRTGIAGKDLGPDQLQQLWSNLAGRDAAKAHTAQWTLIAMGEKTLALCRAKLRAVQPADADHVRRLLADLDSGTFAARDAASRKLKKIGAPAEPWLRNALEKNPSLELRRRIESVLSRPPFVADSESLRCIRAIQVLEQIGGPKAKEILDDLAKGVGAARETQDARAALERLSKCSKRSSGT